MYQIRFYHPSNRAAVTSPFYRTARNVYRHARDIRDAGGWTIIAFHAIGAPHAREIARLGCPEY